MERLYCWEAVRFDEYFFSSLSDGNAKETLSSRFIDTDVLVCGLCPERRKTQDKKMLRGRKEKVLELMLKKTKRKQAKLKRKKNSVKEKTALFFQQILTGFFW